MEELLGSAVNRSLDMKSDAIISSVGPKMTVRIMTVSARQRNIRVKAY
jgi:hypothetical protein